VRGGLNQYDQVTGTLPHTYWTIPSSAPAGTVGASVWASAAVLADGSVFDNTGNEPNGGLYGDPTSILHLDGTNIETKLGSWRIPTNQLITDSDWAGSPTPFTATINGTPTPMVGGCDKNGKYYALNQTNLSAGPVWQYQISHPEGVDPAPGQCDSAAAYDGSHLYMGGNGTTINGTNYLGSVRSLDPATGTPTWETGLLGEIIGSVTLDGAGVLAAGTYDQPVAGLNYAYLLNAATGQILLTIPTGKAKIFGQPVFADNHVLIAGGQSWGLRAYGP
jgi:hypothetical protein